MYSSGQVGLVAWRPVRAPAPVAPASAISRIATRPAVGRLQQRRATTARWPVVVQVDVLDRGAISSRKCGLPRMPFAQPAQQSQRVLRLLLVPEIDQMELVVGFVAQDLAAVAGPQHLAAIPPARSPPGSARRKRRIFAAAGATSA